MENDLDDFTRRFMELSSQASQHGLKTFFVIGETNAFNRTEENIRTGYHCGTSEALGLVQAASGFLMARFRLTT